jgi:glycosyltransferase involved in cell wall biosynthesis
MEWGDAFYVKTIKVTAIVSTYDSADLFVGRMENLVGQSLFARGRLEIIVIDSASPGNERALVKPFVDRHPDRIRYVRTPTRETIYAAWNRAIEMARGEYITTQNVDDRMKQDGLERLARHLDAHPECVLVCGDQERVARGAVFDVESLYRRHWNFVPFSRPRLLFNTQVGSQPMWRTRAHYLAGYFDPAMAAVGDREFYLRLSRHGQFQYIPEVLGSLDYADISLSRSGDAVDLEGHLIIDRCLANKGLADLLGYPVAAEDDELARQVFRNNLCCELAHHFAACRVAWSARGLANMREILASVAGVDGHAAVVAANLARVKACLGADGEAVAAAARLRLEVIAWPPSATVTVGQAE